MMVLLLAHQIFDTRRTSHTILGLIHTEVVACTAYTCLMLLMLATVCAQVTSLPRLDRVETDGRDDFATGSDLDAASESAGASNTRCVLLMYTCLLYSEQVSWLLMYGRAVLKLL